MKNARTIAKILIFSIVALAARSNLAAQERAVTPVPVSKEMLDGTRLVLSKAGCSLDLPGVGWTWMTYDNAGQTFMCVNSKTFEMYVVGVGQLKHDMVDHQPQSLIAGAKKTQESRGGKVENDKYEFIETPGVTKSAKITFNEIEKTKKTFVCVYLFQTIDFALLKVHCNTSAATEPDAFTKMVKSLKMLKPSTDPKPAPDPAVQK